MWEGHLRQQLESAPWLRAHGGEKKCEGVDGQIMKIWERAEPIGLKMIIKFTVHQK
jgi:hypothetical protein